MCIYVVYILVWGIHPNAECMYIRMSVVYTSDSDISSCIDLETLS